MRMNEHNPPMVLPNGYVYGHNVRNTILASNLVLEVPVDGLLIQAIVAMAASNNGAITCPRTKDKCQLRDAEKVYIM